MESIYTIGVVFSIMCVAAYILSGWCYLVYRYAKGDDTILFHDDDIEDNFNLYQIKSASSLFIMGFLVMILSIFSLAWPLLLFSLIVYLIARYFHKKNRNRADKSMRAELILKGE